MIKFMNWADTNKAAVKQQNQWACYISNGLDLSSKNDRVIYDFVIQQIGNLFKEKKDFFSTISNITDGGLFFFESSKEMEHFYYIFNRELTYSSAIYACIYNPNGECLTENK